MKHTPGPWVLLEGHFNDVLEGESTEGSIGSIYSESAELFVVRMDDLGEDANAPEQRANARLIEAAPDMLEACKAALEHSESDIGGGFTWLNDMLRAAIAKAQGGK